VINGLACSSSAYCKGLASIGHSFNDVHPNEQDGGKSVSEGHNNWNAT